MFLSAVWALILTAPIHCRGSIGEQVILHFSKSVLMKKQIHLHLGWHQGEYIFVNYSFKSLHFSTSSTQKNILFIDMNIKCLFIQMFICNRCRLLSVHSSFNSTERRINWIMRSLHTHGDTFLWSAHSSVFGHIIKRISTSLVRAQPPSEHTYKAMRDRSDFSLSSYLLSIDGSYVQR